MTSRLTSGLHMYTHIQWRHTYMRAYTHTYMQVHTHTWWHIHKLKKKSNCFVCACLWNRSPGAEFIGGCYPLCVAAGNRTPVLCKNRVLVIFLLSTWEKAPSVEGPAMPGRSGLDWGREAWPSVGSAICSQVGQGCISWIWEIHGKLQSFSLESSSDPASKFPPWLSLTVAWNLWSKQSLSSPKLSLHRHCLNSREANQGKMVSAESLPGKLET